MVDYEGSSGDPLSPEQLERALDQLLKMLVALPRKEPAEGYKGRVTPLRVIPLVIGVGEDGAYKVLDIREAIDSVPDVVWHDWLKLYGSDFDPDGRRPAASGGRFTALDILRLISGGSRPGRAVDVVSLLRRLVGQ